MSRLRLNLHVSLYEHGSSCIHLMTEPAVFERKVHLFSAHRVELLHASSYDDMARVLRILDAPFTWTIADNETPVQASVKRNTGLGSDLLWQIEDNARVHAIADLAR